MKDTIIQDTLVEVLIKGNQSSRPSLGINSNSHLIFPKSLSIHHTIHKESLSASKDYGINLWLKGCLVNINNLHEEVNISWVMNQTKMKFG